VLRIVALVVAVAGCTGTIDSTESDDTAPDASQELGDSAAVARAQLWVDAKVPYCQAANHQRDYDTACASTCTRPDNPDWDAYRSDCSGLVSWAWGLPAPGRTTKTLAPFDTEVSRAIAAADLMPGDAINNDHHTMVFSNWITPGVRARFLEEPGCSVDQPYAREYISNVTLTGETIELQYRGPYTAIRLRR
jgi:hypothetical protein